MVAPMPFEKMDEISGKLASVIAAYMKDKGLKAGRDISFLISSDGNHYGKDFNNSPFGEGEKAWETALALDRRLIQSYLTGISTPRRSGLDQGALGRDLFGLSEYVLVREIFRPVRTAGRRENHPPGRGKEASRAASSAIPIPTARAPFLLKRPEWERPRRFRCATG